MGGSGVGWENRGALRQGYAAPWLVAAPRSAVAIPPTTTGGVFAGYQAACARAAPGAWTSRLCGTREARMLRRTPRCPAHPATVPGARCGTTILQEARTWPTATTDRGETSTTGTAWAARAAEEVPSGAATPIET